LGELHLVQKSLQLREPEQCHYVQANYFYKLCTDVVRASDHTINKVALWHAGGNWGDLWPGTYLRVATNLGDRPEKS